MSPFERAAHTHAHMRGLKQQPDSITHVFIFKMNQISPMCDLPVHLYELDLMGTLLALTSV